MAGASAVQDGRAVQERPAVRDGGAGLAARAAAWLRGDGRAAEVVRMAADGTLRLAPAGRPLAVAAHGGTVVVTQEGDRDDHVLAPGERVRLAARGVVVVWALSAAEVAVEREQ